MRVFDACKTEFDSLGGNDDKYTVKLAVQKYDLRVVNYPFIKYR